MALDKLAVIAIFAAILALVVWTSIGIRRGSMKVTLGEGDPRESRPFLRWATALPLLLIDGAQARDAEHLLDSLRAMRSGTFPGSSPKARIAVEVQSAQGSVRLELARDSTRAGEFRVFMPRYWMTRQNELGRIQTAALD